MRFAATVAAIFAILTVACAAAVGSGLAHIAGAAPCIPKVSTASGHEVVSYCGPATATITIGKTTYRFKNGYCRKDTTHSIPLALTLGEIIGVHSPVNGGKPLFEMTVLTVGKATSTDVNGDSGGKVLDSVGTVALRGSFPGSGTFTSTGFAKPHFTGSWKCNGPLYTP